MNGSIVTFSVSKTDLLKSLISYCTIILWKLYKIIIFPSAGTVLGYPGHKGILQPKNHMLYSLCGSCNVSAYSWARLTFLPYVLCYAVCAMFVNKFPSTDAAPLGHEIKWHYFLPVALQWQQQSSHMSSMVAPPLSHSAHYCSSE